MANAKKCDRCGVYYDKNHMHPRYVNSRAEYLTGVCMNTTEGYKVNCRDLCDDCITEFKLFMEGKPVLALEERTNENQTLR